MKEYTIGFLTTLSGRWPIELPRQRLEEYGAWCRGNLPARIVMYPEPVRAAQQVEEAVRQFRRKDVDLVIMVYGAFTGDDTPCAIAEGLEVPIILWAPTEPRYEREDRLYANALVAVTMNAAALHRLEARYHVLYGDCTDRAVTDELQLLVRAHGAVAGMRGLLFGLFGYRPTAFYNCAFDEGLIRKTFGVRMEETDLKVVFDRMAEMEPSQVQADMAAIGVRFDPTALPDGHLENHSRLYLALAELFREQGYAYASIKCWPEMGALHTQPCAVLGRLAEDGINIACEGDVDAGLTMTLQHLLTGTPPFITDMIEMNAADNLLTFWHCGNPAPSLIDESDGVRFANHPLVGQGSAFYSALKPGPVTVARLCNIRGAYKLFLLPGTAVPTVRRTKGAMIDVRVSSPVREVFQTIIDEGVPHHYSIVWRDIANEMRRVAALLGLEVIEP